MKTMWAALFLATVPAAQEEDRREGRPGTYTKILTPGRIDAWIFEGREGETILATVRSDEFDPVLELVDGKNRVVKSVDDPGSESRMGAELAWSGPTKIRVHAFGNAGGGRYSLTLERFHAPPMEAEREAVGTVGDDGAGHHRFSLPKGTFAVVSVSTNVRTWGVRDPKGATLEDAFVLRSEDAHYVKVQGPRGMRYSVVVRRARVRPLRATEDRLPRGGMDIYEFDARPGGFRMIEVESTGVRAGLSRLEAETEETRLPDAGPDFRLFPTSAKRHAFAALFRREGRYLLRLRGEGPYSIASSDPTERLERGAAKAGTLPIGGTIFATLDVGAGRLVEITATSDRFDPVLRLYDSDGNPIAADDDGGGNRACRISYLSRKAEVLRVQIHCYGDGGGGEYALRAAEKEIRTIAVGGRAEGTLETKELWAFEGRKGRTVLVHVRAEGAEPWVAVHDPRGVEVGAGELLAVRLPDDGRYTLAVTSKRGGGEYVLQLIEGD